MIRLALSVLMTAVLCAPAIATIPPRTLLGEFRWEELAAQGRIVNGTVDQGGRLTVINDRSEPQAITVLTVDDPGVTEAMYAFCGQVRCMNAEDAGFIEMWSCFPDGSRFFSRTPALSGLSGSLSGSTNWRPFVLPFYLKDDPRRPSKIVLNSVLPGKGSVTLDTVRLIEYARGTDPLKDLPGAKGQWWGERTGGLVGGSIGGLFGILGGLIGTFAGRGRARRFVIGALRAMALCGILSAAACIAALACGQPYAVWYPLALGAVILTVLGFALLPVVRRRYAQLELRRMEALDAK